MAIPLIIVEDEKEICSDLRDLFNTKGFECAGFTDAQEALEYLKINDVPVAVIDIVMAVPPAWDPIAAEHGRKTGILLAREMKKIRGAMKIAAFTVVRDPEINKEMREAGIDAIIHKPEVFDRILETVKRMLK